MAQPSWPSGRPVRPAGVVLVAIALGLAAAFLLLSGTFAVLMTAMGASASAALPTSPAGLDPAVLLVLAFVYFGFAGWAIGTLVGLLRMRPWARVSSIVIAAGVVASGLLFALSGLVVQSLLRSGQQPLPPGLDPRVLHTGVIAMAVLGILLAFAGVIAIIYFARRSVREAFALAQAAQEQQTLTYPASRVPPNSPQTGWPVASPEPYRDPLTDFTVARPLAPAVPEPATHGMLLPDPVVSQTFEAVHPEAQSWMDQNSPTPEAARSWEPDPRQSVLATPPMRTGRPASVTVISVLALISAFTTLLGVVSPLPVFLFGTVVSGWPAHLYALVWSAALAIAGLGMLRLERPAWVLSLALLGVAAVQSLSVLLPSSRPRYLDYMTAIANHSHPGAPAPLPPHMIVMVMMASMIFGLGIIALFATLLWRARWAFLPTAQQTAASHKP